MKRSTWSCSLIAGILARNSLDVKKPECYYLDIKRFETKRREPDMRPSDPTATKIFVDAHVESLRGARVRNRPRPALRVPRRN
jgi:hypothetical protein